MPLVSRSLKVAVRVLKKSAGVTVTIRRGALSGTATAIKGQSEHEQVDDTGAIVEQVRLLDWLIAPAEYMLGGEAVEPKAQDLIEEVSGGVTYTYKVLSPIAGQEPWRYTDPHKTLLRVHSKLVKKI